MKTLLLVFGILFNSLLSYSVDLPKLKVSDDRRFIVTESGKPFLWLGNTAWEMIHRLNREEISLFLEDCSSKGFTVIQTVILAELDGLNTPNAYGERPLINNDPTKLNEEYFRNVDFAIKKASELGLYIGLLPTWGDKYYKKWGTGPEIFTPENAGIYAELLAKRYEKSTNIIWILGGDRFPDQPKHFEVIRAIAKGLKKTDPSKLISFHPWGGRAATEAFNEDWLDIDMFQTTHDRRAKDYEFVLSARKISPARPVINGEARYENIPDRLDSDLRFGWLDDSDVRTSAYWTMLSGAAGYTYGCNDVWQMYSVGKDPIIRARTDWSEAIHLPGSQQMKFLHELFSKFPWQQMINDQNLILNNNQKDSTYMVCARSLQNDFILAYTPFGKPLTLDLSILKSAALEAYWFNPRSGKTLYIGNFSNSDKPVFEPWSIGRGSDFILLVKAKDYPYKL